MKKALTTNSHNQRAAKISPARRSAFDILRRVEESNGYTSFLLAAHAEKLQPNDRALTRELVMGVLRRQLWLDRLVDHYGTRDSQRLDAPVRIALRLGLFQLRFMSRVPESAAVNESVNLVRSAGLSSAGALVNAILRRATRERDYDPVAKASDPMERLSIETSHPLWLVQRWVAAWGWEQAVAFVHANNEIPPTAFRIVHESANRDAVLSSLILAGAVVDPSKITNGGWRCRGESAELHELAARGKIYIQDEASQLAVRVLNPVAGNLILDVCAAPGGKTTYSADLAGPSALVVAGDVHRHRLRTVKEAAVSQQLANIRFVVLDAINDLPFATMTFDRVLVDAPCSGTGTLRHNPEIRWRITAADLEDLSRRQLQILLNAARMVKPGGLLVYSTCSVEQDENEEVIENFLKRALEFQPAPLQLTENLLTTRNTARVWPQRHGADGFFIAAFQRV